MHNVLLQVVNEIILWVYGCNLYTASLIPRNVLTVCLKLVSCRNDNNTANAGHIIR